MKTRLLTLLILLANSLVLFSMLSFGDEPVVAQGATDIVLNGDFEIPIVYGNYCCYSVGQIFGNWTVESGTIDLTRDYQNATGYQSVDLSGVSAGTIYQELPTNPGQSYILNFSMAGNPDGSPPIKQMEIGWGLTYSDTLSFDATGRSRSNMGWVSHQYTVVATDNVTRLRFKSLTDSSFGPFLDAVSVVPVTSYSISGRVADSNNNSISDVTISVGAGHTATTDSRGTIDSSSNYTLTGLAVGTYTLTPSKSGYTFSPASRTVTVPVATGQNFTGVLAQTPPAPFLELPLRCSGHRCTEEEFRQFARGAPSGRINSWFDHGGTNYNRDRLVAIGDCKLGLSCYLTHRGTDFETFNVLEPVYPAASGKVLRVEQNPASAPSYGKFVDILHANGYVTRYAHLSEINVKEVKEGDPVGLDTIIGKVGDTGAPGEIHLHFGVYFTDGSQVIPGDVEAIDPFGWQCSSEFSSSDPWVSTRGRKSSYLWKYLAEGCPISVTSNPYPWLLGPAISVVSGSGYNPSVTNQFANVSATSNGIGTITIAQYLSNPVGAPPPLNALKYYDIHISGTFSLLIISYCGLSPGTPIYFWDGSKWVAASNTSYDGDCVRVTVNDNTVPNLTQLSGTLFAAGSVQQIPTPTPKPQRQEDGYEPDNTMALAHTITGPQLHNFCGAKDEDWVKFFVPSGWTLHVKADPPSNFPTEPHLELYSEAGVVAQNDHYFGNIAEIWYWNNGPDQTFYIRATELKGRGDCGSSTYTLSLEQIQGAPVSGMSAPTLTPTRIVSARVVVPSSPTPLTVRQIRSATPTATLPLVARALPIPSVTSASTANSVAKQSAIVPSTKGSTINNPDTGAQVTFAPGVLPSDAQVVLQAANEPIQPLNSFLLVSQVVNVQVQSETGSHGGGSSEVPMRLCLSFTDEQVEQAGGNVNNLVVIQNPGASSENETRLNRATGRHLVCVDATADSTYALAVRAVNREGQIIPAQGLVNVMSFALLSGSALLAFAAFALRGGWLRRG